jgi:hypothetical protein
MGPNRLTLCDLTLCDVDWSEIIMMPIFLVPQIVSLSGMLEKNESVDRGLLQNRELL